MHIRLCCVLIFCLNIGISQVERPQYFTIEGDVYEYQTPSVWDMFTKVPSAYGDFFDRSFSNDALEEWAWIGGSTALLMAYDQEIYDETARFGRRIGLGNEDNTETFVSIGDMPFFRAPTDFASTMYFFGDGWFHLSIALGYYTFGEIYDDNRALQTSSQIAQGMLTAGIMTQTLKHITGHETPNRATVKHGKWRFFPNQADYNKNVPKYDAFPSGHLATAMMTFTVIVENYPELGYIKPIGYTMMTLLSFEMVNNGVHWASDYPLAVGIGYLFGKIAVENGRKKISSSTENTSYEFHISPKLNPWRSEIGISFAVTF